MVPHFSDKELPAELTIDILSRLPVKTIIHCKRVCKKRRNLVLDSSFLHLHLSRSPTGLLLHQNGEYLCYDTIDPGILKWVEIEDKVDHHHLHHDPPMSLDLNIVSNFQNSLIDQTGSVNGFICLWQYSLNPKFDDTYICNPVTREMLILPTLQYYKQDFATIVYGFGVDSLTGEYKVVQTFQGKIPLNGNKSGEYKVISEAEVYTLGTGQWRNIGRLPYRIDGSNFGAYLNNHCHWIVLDKEDALENICTFDLNKETFQLFPSPPSKAIEESCYHSQRLGVLKSCLCKLDAYSSQLTIWVMKEYGIKKSWHKDVVITEEALSRDLQWPNSDTISLIQGLKDGTILLVRRGLCAYYPRSDAIEMFDWLESGLTYRPSFLRLQNFEPVRVHMF